MKRYLMMTAMLLMAKFTVSAATLSIQPAHALPEYSNSLIWDAKTLPADKDTWGAIFVADFNHDQRFDAVILQGPATSPSGAFELGVYLQNADGAFLPKATYAINTSLTYVILGGDFNEDGHLDLLVDDRGNDLLMLLGKGDGTFQEPKHLGFSAPISPVIADLNGDKHLDVVSGAAGDGTVTVFTGKGDGTFNPPMSLATTVRPQSFPAPGAGQIMVGDVNRDGKVDIVVASPVQDSPTWTGNLDVCLGKGDGTFQDPITTPNVAALRGALGDFNGDGLLDYVGDHYSPAQLEVWLGKGGGHFVKGGSFPVAYPPIIVATSDLNGDGILDLVITGNPPGELAPLSILLGKGDGAFQPSQTFTPISSALVNWSTLPILDFNGDTLPDLVMSMNGPKNTDKGVGLALALNPGVKADPRLGFLIDVQNSEPGPVVLEASANLVDWTPVATNATPITSWPVVDTTAGQAQRFYRTRRQ